MAKTVGQLKLFDKVYRPTIVKIVEFEVKYIESISEGVLIRFDGSNKSSANTPFIANKFMAKYYGVHFVDLEDAKLAQRNMRIEHRNQLMKKASEANIALIEFTEKYF